MTPPPLLKFPLLPRKKNTDKSAYGHVLVIGGSSGMPGAAVLAAKAALVSGGGLVTLAVPKSLEGLLVRRRFFEAMCLPLPETRKRTLALSSYAKIIQFVKRRKISALVLGPGLSQHPETRRLVRRLIAHVTVPTVLDADGLNSFKGRARLFLKHPCPLVLTPHRKEFERLFEKPWPEKKPKRIALAKRLSGFYDAVLVLKGHRTLVVSGRRVYENTTGNPGMAKGGSGDVLTGVIASFIGQGLEPFEAAAWAVYFHGKAGDIAAGKKGELSILAGDLIDCLPKAFKSDGQARIRPAIRRGVPSNDGANPAQ